MPSESEQETDSLKARLKAKLKKAGVLEVDSSSDEEVKPRKNTKSASKGNYSKVHKKSDIQHRINGHSPANSRCSTMASPASSDSDEVTSKPNHRVMRALESDESDSDSSDITHPRASCKRRPNVSSGSDEDGSDEGGSDEAETENSEAEGSDLIGSDDDDVEEGSDSDACSMIDNEAEEVEGTDSGSADEEGPGDLISSSESDWEDDWISETDDLPTNHCSNPKASPNKSARSNSCGVITSSGFASDSSDGTSEKCPICLLRFSNQEVGTPESCDHVFCAECLEQWSKNVNTCPVDRQEFTLILVRRRVGGKVVRQIRVERAESKEEAQEDPTFCEICGNSDREDRMLLCDGCDLGYHMECLNPPLTHVPIDNWYCSDCDHNNTNIAEEVDFGIDEVHELLEEAESAGTPQARPRPRPPRSSRPVRSVRTIPRTLQYERVLGQVQHALLERREARLAEPSTSSGVQSRKRKLVRPESSSKKRRRTVPRKKKSIKKKKLSTTTRKRSTKKKTTTTSKTGVKKRVGVKKKVVKKKRKTKRKLTSKSKKAKRSTRKETRIARVPASHSVKGRLAEQLGMRPLRQPWQTTPELRSTPSISGIVLERSRAGIPTLHLFGQRDQLDYFSGSDEEMGAGGGVAVVAQPRETLSLAQRLMNRKRLAASLNNPNRRLRLNEPIVSTRSDLVDSILLSQTKMLSKKTDVKINIDGSLNIVLKEPTMKPCLPDPLKDRLGENHVDVREVSPSATGLIVQAPMYAGGRRGQSAQNSFSGNNYSGSRRGRGTGGRGGGGAANSGNGGSVNNSSFRSSFNNPDHSRAQYEQFLGNNHGGGRPPRSQPLRFRLNAPRRPLRRNVMRRRGQQPADNEDDEEEDVLESVMESDAQDAAKDTEESGGGPKEDEEVDIYSDIEAESHKEGEDADSEYGALLPPPEPPAILMNMGGQHSDEEGSDNELVIDDKAKGPSDETDDKYDPAEPCDDSDDGNPSNPRADEIPLPPEPGPALKHVIAYSDEESRSGGVSSPEKDTTTTNKGNPQDTPEDLSVSIVHPISKRSDGTCKDRNQKEAGSDLDSTKRTDPSGGEESSEDDDDDCPNFSIYSATSVNIARQVGEDESDDGKEKEIETGVDQKLPDEILPSSSSVGKAKSKHVESGAETADISIEGEDPEKKASEDSLLQVDIEKSEKKALEDSADRDESDESGSEENASSKGTAQTLVEEIFGADEDSEAATPVPAAPVMPGLEGLETETISDNEEAMLDEDLSEQESDLCSKRRRRGSDEGADFEDGEIVDETQRGKRERKRARKDGDENADDARKSRRRRDSPSKERPPLSSSENRNRDKNKEKDKEKDKKKGRDDDKTKERGKDDIAWKKPSKSTKDRNYRDGKEKAKGPEKEREKGREDKRDDERENGRKDRKKKEKRKDLERYDVRKVLSDKTLSRQNKDAFGRDIDIRRRSRTNSRSNSRSRGRARSRSRSRSHRRTARSRSRSRSRGRSPGRARLRNRSASYDRLRQRKSRSRSRLRGSRSRQRAGNRSRSLRRSPNRSKDRARKSRSRDRMRKKSGENRLDGRDVRDMREARDLPSRARNEPMNSVTREPRRERGERGVEREMVRTQESWPRSFSRSLSRSLSRSMSGSPQYPMSEDEAETLRTRSYSRSWSRERVEHVSTTDMAGGKHKTHKNLTVIVTNNKDETRRKKKEGKRGKGRYASPPPSKEVFASGDNILVSVNFKSNKSGDGVADPYALEKSSKRKRDEGRNKRPKKDRGNRTRTDTPPLDSSKPADKRRKPLPPEASQKPVAIIDLEQSPYKEFTPSPKDLIILSDSDDDNMQPTEQELQQMKQKLHDEINAVPEEPLLAMGPKTPPEPQVKFSISSKNVIRTINNPLHEDEDEGGDEEAGGLEIGTSRSEADSECIHKGPNTPPESPSGPATPGSSPTSPDAYDPFEPTASPRSESPDEGAGIGDRSNVLDKSNEPLENGSIGNLVEDESRPKTDIIDDARILSPKLDGEAASPGTTAIEADEVDKSKPMSPSSSAEATAVKTPMKAIAAAGGSTEVTSSTSTSRSAPSRAATQTDRHLLMKGSLSVRPATKPGTPVKAIPRQNGEQSVQPDVIDMDLDSPYSPGSSEGDDLFEPPPVYSSKGTPSKTASRPKPTSGSASKTEKFDMLFGSSPRQRVKYGSTVRPKHSSKNSGRNQAKLNRIVKQMTRSRKDGAMRTTDEDQLKILDEVPSSAVELQVKDKFLKKLNRQERVVEEVKLALKPHYYKKHINKEDYKEILRRSVPKICHNKSGEINPMKIQTLVEAYVKKIRYLKKKAAIASGQLKPKGSKKQTD